MTNKKKEYLQFPGFKENYRKDFFTYPSILEKYWCQMSGSEQKVLDFILRQTFGWRKKHDVISLRQFSHGIGTLSNGTGLSSSQIQRAIKGLEKQGFITVTRASHKPSKFMLVLDPLPSYVPKSSFPVFKKHKLEN